MNIVTMEIEKFERLFGAVPDSQDARSKLIDSLERATIAAMAYANEDDGGTSNFDAPAFDFEGYGMSQQDAESAIQEAGLRSYTWEASSGRRRKPRVIGLVIVGFQSGQGNRRTEMSKAFTRSLDRDGIPCGIYYQMD